MAQLTSSEDITELRPQARERIDAHVYVGPRRLEVDVAVADWVQVGSLAGVICALLISVFQNRNTARQAREATVQTRAAQQALERTGYLGFMRAQADWRSFTYVGDPDLLRWHLQIRGYPVSTDESNKRTLYVLLKLDVHEETFLSHQSGLLGDDIWIPWQRVLDADLKVPEFIAVWSIARPFYAQSFAAHVDQILDRKPLAAQVDREVSRSAETALSKKDSGTQSAPRCDATTAEALRNM